jgi:hypothetical protein
MWKLALVGGCAGEPMAPPGPAGRSDRGGLGTLALQLPGNPVTLDERRSLAVTDAAILSAFSLSEVMNQLAAQSGVPGLTGARLFAQLWDTQLRKPGVTDGEHCDDENDGLETSFNGFPLSCRPDDGAQAFDPDANLRTYFAVGLFNRFDLAPADGSDCGEYRMVFARADGPRLNLINFEGLLPNPARGRGLDGCRPVTNLWRDLSSEDDLGARAASLHGFFFRGLGAFPPVVHIDNYGNAEPSRRSGQVRTDQFLESPWVLHEFKLRTRCAAGACKLEFRRETDKVNPFGLLFKSSVTSPQALMFRSSFLSQVASLAVNDLNRFNYIVPDEANTGESLSTMERFDRYVDQFEPGSAFAQAIQDRLTALGSTLTPTQIVARAQALSCAGCHQLSNGADLGHGLIWPTSATSSASPVVPTHVKTDIESGPQGPRFRLSPALTGVFLPHRRQVLESFLGSAARTRTQDFDGDGHSDIVWRNDTTGQLFLMQMNGFTRTAEAAVYTEPALTRRVVAQADFHGDGTAALLYRDELTGVLSLVQLSGLTATPPHDVYGEPNLAWKVVAAADFDGDGCADILYRNDQTGMLYILFMRGFEIVNQGVLYTEPNLDWKVIQAGDLNGDGMADVVYRNEVTGTVHALLLRGTRIVSQGVLHVEPDLHWQVVQLADFDGDGDADLLYRHRTTGQVYELQLDGLTVKAQQLVYTEPDPQWHIVATGDYDGDGKADLLWRHDGTGQVHMMLMDGFMIRDGQSFYREPDLAWKVLGAR